MKKELTVRTGEQAHRGEKKGKGPTSFIIGKRGRGNSRNFDRSWDRLLFNSKR